ncbi:histidine kinase [Aureisphaera galaxeae]|uniref:sensor histidine kinase n=1 Tax=Aureisphaera galaxeae TaxID=1538023 RepID=UPI002350C9B5|nr:ATP-binding protein [Aureisphaera galaxeae]MDC8002452.1 histidine kinase [Aureisphaera galaxeae]
MGEENNQIVLIFIASAAFVVLMAILLILFLVIYQKRIVAQENKLQKIENERQQVLLKATIEGQERERKRLAKELHDGIGSLLSGLSLTLKFQKNKQTPNSEEAHFFEETCRLVDEGIEDMRRVSHDFMPATIEEFGLITALQECIKPVNNSKALHVQMKIPKTAFPLPKNVALGVLRIFQELLQNTLKHAQASEVVTTLEFHPNRFRMLYTDNGIGMKAHEMDSHGIGMKSIQSRIQAMEGDFSLHSENKDGFAATVEVPINHNEVS